MSFPIIPSRSRPEGARIWLWLLTSQSGSSEPCLKGLSAISAAEKPGEPREVIRCSDPYQGQGVMTNSPLIPLGDYLGFLSLLAHILTLKRKGGHALFTVSCAAPKRTIAISCFCFTSPIVLISFFPRAHGFKQNLTPSLTSDRTAHAFKPLSSDAGCALIELNGLRWSR